MGHILNYKTKVLKIKRDDIIMSQTEKKKRVPKPVLGLYVGKDQKF